jgi:hypothetical protein
MTIEKLKKFAGEVYEMPTIHDPGQIIMQLCEMIFRLPSAPGEINSGKVDDGDLKIAWELANTTDKPFFVDTVRKLIRQYDKEEISLSKFVEVLNITAYKWKSGKVDEKDSGIESHLKSAYKRNSDFGQIINKQIKEIDYWKKRCEAAERVIDETEKVMPYDISSYDFYAQWQALKQQSIKQP